LFVGQRFVTVSPVFIGSGHMGNFWHWSGFLPTFRTHLDWHQKLFYIQSFASSLSICTICTVNAHHGRNFTVYDK